MNRMLFIINSFVGGGAERVTTNLITHLSTAAEIDVITIYRDCGDGYSLPSSVRVLNLGLDAKMSGSSRLLRLAASKGAVDDFIRTREEDGRYSLVTAHLTASHILASMSCVRDRCLYVHHALVDSIEEGAGRVSRRVFRWLYRGKGLVAVSEGVKRQLIETYALREEDVEVIYNAVPLESIRDNSSMPIPFERPFILWVGRLTDVKRPQLMMRIYAEGDLRGNYDLVFLGQGPLEHDLRQLASRLGIEDSVHLMGFQSNPFSWMAHASAMVMTSKWEALPTVLVEGLFSGAKVVAGDCDFGPREILTGELSQFLVPKDDVKAYLSAIAKAQDQYPVITDEFKKRYEASEIAAHYLDFYRDRYGRGVNGDGD